MDPHRIREVLWFGNLVLILTIFCNLFFSYKQIKNEKEIKIPDPSEIRVRKKQKSITISQYSPLWELRIAPPKKIILQAKGPTPEEELIESLKLMSVAFEGVSKSNSFATMQTKLDRRTKLVYIGDVYDRSKNDWYRKSKVPASVVHPATIVDISSIGVTFIYKGQRAVISSGANQRGPNNSKLKPPPSQKLGENQWSVSMVEKEEAFSKIDFYMKETGLVPYYNRGRFAGLKIKRLSKDSLIGQRGIKRNDVIQKVNGITLSSLNQLKGILNREKNKRRFIIQVSRLGKPVRLTFEIQ